MSSPKRKQTDEVIDLAASIAPTGDEEGGVVDIERRDDERHPYQDPVAIVLLNSSGNYTKPMIVRSRDISTGGIRVITRHMIHPGSRGVIQLMRSDGTHAFIGVKIMYCHYAGNMQHHTGMQFIPIPHELSSKSFVDDDGNAILLKDTSRTNRPRQS